MAYDLASLINTFRNAQTEANTANKARYNQLMGMYGDSSTSIAGLINQFRNRANRRIGRRTAQAKTQVGYDLASRGMMLPSIQQSLESGLDADAELQRTYVGEAGLRQRAAATMGKIGAITNRADQAPDMGMFASLLAAASNNASSMMYAPTYSSGSTGLQNAVNSFRSRLGLQPISY